MVRAHFGRLLAFLLATSLWSACSSDSDSEPPGPGTGGSAGSGATGAGGGRAPTTGWAKSFDAHSLFTDQGPAVAIDASSNVLVAGTMGRTGGGPVGGGGYGDAFAASFTSSGDHRWSKALGHPGVTGEFGAAVDDEGNFYLAGAFDEGRYVASFGPGGSERWWGRAATAPSDNYLFPFAVAVNVAVPHADVVDLLGLRRRALCKDVGIQTNLDWWSAVSAAGPRARPVAEALPPAAP